MITKDPEFPTMHLINNVEERQMRILLVIIFTAIISGCVSQPIKETDREFERIIEIPNTSSDVIYERSKMWIAENFVSSKAVLEYDNRETGRLIGNGRMDYPCSGLSCMGKTNWDVKFTMKVDSKDSKLRVTFSKINLAWPYSHNGGIPIQAHDGPVHSQSDMNAIKVRFTELSNQLVAYINNPKNNQEDW